MNEKTIQECSAYEIVMIVRELHQRGYEQLRLFSGMSPNGVCWRWMIYPKALLGDSNEEEQCYGCFPFECLHGSTSQTRPKNRPVITADDVIPGNEDYFRMARGRNPEYVSWFAMIVEHAECDDFPIAFEEHSNERGWRFMNGKKIPYPPFNS